MQYLIPAHSGNPHTSGLPQVEMTDPQAKAIRYITSTHDSFMVRDFPLYIKAFRRGLMNCKQIHGYIRRIVFEISWVVGKALISHGNATINEHFPFAIHPFSITFG